MGYGLRLRDASGNVILDTSDMVARIRYYVVVNSGVSDSITLSDINGKTTAAFSISLEDNKIAHSVTISGTTFSWVAQSFTLGMFSRPSSSSLIGVVIVD
jgi:hypothetical protein